MGQKKKKKLIWVLIGSIIVGIISLGIIFISQKQPFRHDKKNKLPENPPLPEKSDECPYLTESNLTASDSKYEKQTIKDEELTQWRKIPNSYVIELWKKGYHWHDILQLWGWKIPETEVPDLKTEKRTGVINQLAVMYALIDRDIPKEERKKMDKYVGLTQNLVVIMRKIPGGGPVINIDKGQFDISVHARKEPADYTKKIINLFLNKEDVNPSHYQISILDSWGAENFGQEIKIAYGRAGGKSAGSAVYLALLSAYHQQPISHSVTATGALSLSTKITKKGKVNEQEFTINPGTNLPIQGLKWKTQAATEKGIDRFVLSKYQSPPCLLSEWQRRKWKGVWDNDNNKIYTEEKWVLAENYQEVVPAETKAKIKEVHWTENIQDLRDLVLQSKLS